MNKTLSKGFTLIELLVVIAILGILAAVVLVAINPAERIAEAKDTQVKSDLSAVATAIETCFTQKATGLYDSCDTTAELTAGQFLKTAPQTAVTYLPKTVAPANTEIKVHARLTATSARPTSCSTSPYITYSSIDGTTTVTCAAPAAF
jgi:prepilin-type N-terminal cleavage/methylation domain-containing protein